MSHQSLVRQSSNIQHLLQCLFFFCSICLFVCTTVGPPNLFVYFIHSFIRPFRLVFPNGNTAHSGRAKSSIFRNAYIDCSTHTIMMIWIISLALKMMHTCMLSTKQTHTYHIPDSISTNWSPSTRRHRMYIINKQMKNAPKQQQLPSGEREREKTQIKCSNRNS